MPLRQEPLSSIVDRVLPPSDEEEMQYAMINSEFGNLFLEEDTGNHLRLVYLRRTLEDYKKGTLVPNLSIIAADSELQKGGELILSAKSYFIDKFFNCKKGFHILKKGSAEDVVVFDIYRTEAI